jgi:arylamine N-acetyltransferase
MPKICVQRKVEVWVEDSYTVDEINDDIIQQAINYELPFENSDTLWETQIELGPIEIYDEKWKKIYTNEGEYSHECFNK